VRTITSIRELRKIAEGREAEIFAWEDGSVLRLFRDARSERSVEREAAAMRAGRSVLPLVPAVLGRVEIEGRPGLVVERVDGPDLLTLLARRPWQVWRVGAICGNLHADLHEIVAPPEVPALRALIPAALPGVPPHVAEVALRELASLPDGDRLCHGDFHPGNVLMSAHGPVVIDWPNAVRCDPIADHSRTLLLLQLGALPPGTPIVVRVGAAFARRLVRASYVRTYRRRRQVDAELLRRWTVVVAAARLTEDIPGERPGILRLLEKAGVRP